MKSKIVGWALAALFILAVVAVANRVSFIRNLISPPSA